MIRRLAASAALVLVVLAALVLPAPAVYAATNPYGGVPCGEAAGSAICSHTGGNPIDTVLHNITNIVAVIAGVAAVIVIIMAGIRFMSAGGNAEEVAKARRAIILAATGLIIIVLARAIINLIISRI